MQDTVSAVVKSNVRKKPLSPIIKRHLMLYGLLSPSLILVILLQMLPILGLILAFKNFDIQMSNTPLIEMFTSPWAGFSNIKRLFTTAGMGEAVWNTIKISGIVLIFSSIIPVVLALLFNELKVGVFKKTVQTVSYLPYFLSTTIILGILGTFYGENGPVNDIVVLFGGERTAFLQIKSFFIPNVVITTLWKGAGWGTIIYLAALAGGDPQQYEAARIDGADKWKQLIYITIPLLVPIAVINLILNIATILGSDFGLVYGLRNLVVKYETIDTLIYRLGLLDGDYAMSAALGFVRGMIALALTFGVNFVAKKASDISVF